MKCDEKKPFCSRCIRFKTQCAGYPKPRANQPPRRPLLPKSAAMEVILRCPVTTQLFDSEQDLRYFRIFCQETAHQISGPFNTGLWNRLMPQASEAVPFVRHAIIAVGKAYSNLICCAGLFRTRQPGRSSGSTIPVLQLWLGSSASWREYSR